MRLLGLDRTFMTFATLGLSSALVRAARELGLAEPTPIQMRAIPAALA